jgi:similar to stage IV sporulation protein
MLYSLWNYLTGYVIIEVKGLSLERLMNAAAQLGIDLWATERVSYTCLHARVRPSGFRKLKRAMKKGRVRCRIHILEKHGLPFFLSAFRFRKAILFGGIVAAALLIGALQLVWTMEVTGSVNVDKADVLAAVEAAGIKPFMLKKDVDRDALATIVRTSDARIAWTDVRVQGVKLVIEIVEGEAAPELIESERACDIVAEKDGIIKTITVYSGKAMCKVGDAVKAGDVLISGTYERGDGGNRYVHARGDVKASIWYTGTAQAGSTSLVRERTDNTALVKTLYVAGFEFPISEPPFALYDTERETTDGMERLYVPLAFHVKYIREVVERSVAITADEMRAIAQSEATGKAEKLLPHDAAVVNRSCAFTEIDGGVRADVSIETEEKMGIIVYKE